MIYLYLCIRFTYILHIVFAGTSYVNFLTPFYNNFQILSDFILTNLLYSTLNLLLPYPSFLASPLFSSISYPI